MNGVAPSCVTRVNRLFAASTKYAGRLKDKQNGQRSSRKVGGVSLELLLSARDRARSEIIPGLRCCRQAGNGRCRQAR